MASLPNPVETLQGEELAIYNEVNARRTKAAGHPLDGPYLPLMYHPELAEKVEKLGYYMRFQSTLPRDVYQFVVLSVGRARGVAFEWVDHVDSGRAAGLPAPVLDAILHQDTGVLPEPYITLARAIESILEFKSLPQPIQDRVAHLFGIKGLVEIVVLCGFYDLIGVVNQSFDVPLPPGKNKPF